MKPIYRVLIYGPVFSVLVGSVALADAVSDALDHLESCYQARTDDFASKTCWSPDAVVQSAVSACKQREVTVHLAYMNEWRAPESMIASILDGEHLHWAPILQKRVAALRAKENRCQASNIK